MSILSRISNLFRGFMSMFVSSIEKQNPEALLELEKENLRKLISQYNDGLASHAALCERLMTQVKKEEKEEADMTRKTTAHLKAGNKAAAGQYALRLQTVKAELLDNRAQLKEAEKTYQNLVKARDVAVHEAKAKIESVRRSIGDLKVKRATAELNEMAAGMISDIGGSGDTLNRLHDMVEEEREQASGRARVAKDGVDIAEIEIHEQEHEMLADQALADFAAEAGIAMESESAPSVSSSASKSMGGADKTAQ